jgi:DNA-binding NarL/FixJ family response regulator
MGFALATVTDRALRLGRERAREDNDNNRALRLTPPVRRSALPSGPRVLVVDDHPITRRGLAAVLRDALGAVEVLEAGDAQHALALARAHRPRLVLTDMYMPGSVPTRELCAQLRALMGTAPIVVVTALERSAGVRDCLQAGANGCLLKEAAEADLAEALRSIVAGRVVIDPRVAQRLATEFLVDGASREVLHLTARERDVLDCLADGRSNRQIAQKLTITEATAKGHVSSLLQKLGVSSRLEAVVRAAQVGLL